MSTGTVFYFAVESEDELSVWMDHVTMATFKQDFSSSGQESEGKLSLSHFWCNLPGVAVSNKHHFPEFISQKYLYLSVGASP
jgi:hypothetical protein